MAHRSHEYRLRTEWTGNRGTGTSGYRDYSRDHAISGGSKPLLPGSSDPAFRGDAARYNPEDLLVASLSGCHMLWYLHLCATNGLVVTSYVDDAVGTMEESPDGSGRFTYVVLRPRIAFAGTPDLDLARRLHHEAHAKCFIANSVNFTVEHEPVFTGE